jgi:hypothetical protein
MNEETWWRVVYSDAVFVWRELCLVKWLCQAASVATKVAWMMKLRHVGRQVEEEDQKSVSE